jgi:hypothetical protein
LNQHQGSNAEVTVELKLNQGVCTDVMYYHPCLNFLSCPTGKLKIIVGRRGLLSFFQEEESDTAYYEENEDSQ